jgi:hypothetical protein
VRESPPITTKALIATGAIADVRRWLTDARIRRAALDLTDVRIMHPKF